MCTNSPVHIHLTQVRLRTCGRLYRRPHARLLSRTAACRCLWTCIVVLLVKSRTLQRTKRGTAQALLVRQLTAALPGIRAQCALYSRAPCTPPSVCLPAWQWELHLHVQNAVLMLPCHSCCMCEPAGAHATGLL